MRASPTSFWLITVFGVFVWRFVCGFDQPSELTLDRAAQLSLEEIRNYRQPSYKLVDPVGDLILSRRVRAAEDVILRVLRGQGKMEVSDPVLLEPGDVLELKERSGAGVRSELSFEEDSQLDLNLILALGLPERDQREIQAGIANRALSLQGRDSPIRTLHFIEALVEVINQERKDGNEPSLGTPHRWSDEFLETHRQSSKYNVFSKILNALALGVTRAFLRTDQESALHARIMTYGHDSLTYPELFRESYRLNRGDLYLTLLTMENLLAHHWRYEQRESLPSTRRLRPIVSGYNYDHDRFGTWYHLTGTILYGYVAGAFKAGVVGRIEAIGSRIIYPNANATQKRWMNIVGGEIGAGLRRKIESGEFRKQPSDPARLAESYYLNRAEDFRDRIHVPLDPDLHASLERHSEDAESVTRVLLESRGLTLRGCKSELMYDLGRGFDSSWIVRGKVDVAPGRRALIPSNARGVRAVRGVLSDCQGVVRELFFEAR